MTVSSMGTTSRLPRITSLPAWSQSVSWAGDGGIVGDAGLHLGGAEDQLVFGEVEQSQLAVVLPVLRAATSREAMFFLLKRGEGLQERELRLRSRPGRVMIS